MERIRLTADCPGYLKVWDIEEELLDFSKILNEKYDLIDFEFWFCFRALKNDAIASGWKSKVAYYKKDAALSFDIIMPESKLVVHKKDTSEQKRIMGHYFFPFLEESIKKYAKKLPTLYSCSDNLIEDMRQFLIQKKWL